MTSTEYSPSNYRIFVRNYDFTPGGMVINWIDMSLELKLNDVSTCMMTMRFDDFMDSWAPDPTVTSTWLSNKTSGVCAQEVGTGILIWRNQDVRPTFHGPLVDFHRIKRSDDDDMVELTFESDETYLKRRLVFPDGTDWDAPVYYNAGTRLWNPEWENLNTATTALQSGDLMRAIINGNAAQNDATALRAISKIGANYQFRVLTGAVPEEDGFDVDSYTDKMCNLLEMCQTLCKLVDTPDEELIFECTLLPDHDGTPGPNSEYVNFWVRAVNDKRNYVSFSWNQGNILEFDFREHVPGANVMHVQGDGSDFTTRIWTAANIARTDIADSIAKYGYFEAYCQKSDFESGELLADKLAVMEDFGHTQLQSKLFNITANAKVKETSEQYISPDCPYVWVPPTDYDHIFWLGDYVTVTLDENMSYSELVRQININVNADGEEIEVSIGPPTIEYNTAEWYSTMGVILGLRKDVGVIKGRR